MNLLIAVLVSIGLLGFLIWKYFHGTPKPTVQNIVPIKVEEPFIPSSSFQGKKQNYVFKLDTQGLGYYKEK
jgi:hypothetical protein